MSPRQIYIMVLLCATALCGCLGEAEHSNPLDPGAPGFDSVGTVGGTTTRLYPPHSPVPGAEVQLSPGGFASISDAEGRFSIRGVPVGVYEITAEKDGFESLPKSIEIDLGAMVDTHSVRLDALPAIESFMIRSLHISRWFPAKDLYFLEIVADVTDPDGLGDIAEVWIEIPAHGYAYELDETIVAGRFEARVQADSLPGASLYALQGSEFVVKASDEPGFVVTSEPGHIIRIIDYTPVAVAPQGQDSVLATPTFSWEDAGLPYAYTYRIDVIRDEANVQSVAATIEGVPRDSLAHTLETPLPAGTYFWTVSVVDEFGNRSRSKEAGFIIE